MTRKEAHVKLGAREGVVAEEINTMKKKSSTLHWGNGKDALRASLEMMRLPTSQGQGHKGVNFIGRLYLWSWGRLLLTQV